MTTVDTYKHMMEAWKEDGNPFPAEAIRSGSNQPVYKDLFLDETQEFNRKFIRSGVIDGAHIGFLWSQGPGGDTGYGKTTMMQVAAEEINGDLGIRTLTTCGVSQNRLVPIAAAYTNLNNLNAAGLYPVLHNAVIYAAEPRIDGKSIFDKARERIVDQLGEDDASKIASHLLKTSLNVAPTASPLRKELVSAFADNGGNDMLQTLAQVTETSRIRNGRQYLDFAIVVLAAAGIDHLFIFVDQLEDLATNKSVNSAKRSREIGRIRDFLEVEPYASRLHLIFTFHNNAARILSQFWEPNRLPRFEIADDNTASVVVLSGLHRDEQVEELLRVYLAEKRTEEVDDPLLPFEPSSASVLRTVSQGRVGVLLTQARELYNAVAERGLPMITGDFATNYFRGQVGAVSEAVIEEPANTDDIDDILLA